MSRRRRSEGYIQQKISLDATLVARFSRLHWDRVLGKMKYGAVSQVLNGLLADYVNKCEAGEIQPKEILSDNEQLAEKNL